MLKISIITICYNEKDRIKQTIESVLKQTYSNIEYLIIDGASTDGTIGLVQEYSKYKNMTFFSEKDNGIYDAMNRGIAKASGDFLYFINAGDFFYDDYVIENMVSYVKEKENTIYYGKTCLIYADGLIQIEDFSEWEGTLKEKIFNGNMPCHQSIFAPKKSLMNHLFREEYRIRADYEWFVYSICNGYKCISIPIVISCFDVTGVSGRLKTNNLFKKEESEILQKYKDDFTEEEKNFRIKSINAQENSIVKYRFLFRLMSSWMSLMQKKISIGEFLKKKGYRYIAIYGMSHMGLRLLDELNEAGLIVKYVMDKNINNLYIEVNKIESDKKLEDVDAIIVTSINSFYEIKDILTSKISCPIISLEDLIYDVVYVNNNQ